MPHTTSHLSLQQIADIVARKRRRDLGDPYMENRLAGLSERGLTAADEAGIYGMLDDQPLAGAEMMDYDNPSLRGQYSQWYGRPNRGQFVDYLRAQFPDIKFNQYNKTQGLPFTTVELTQHFDNLLNT